MPVLYLSVCGFTLPLEELVGICNSKASVIPIRQNLLYKSGHRNNYRGNHSSYTLAVSAVATLHSDCVGIRTHDDYSTFKNLKTMFENSNLHGETFSSQYFSLSALMPSGCSVTCEEWVTIQ